MFRSWLLYYFVDSVHNFYLTLYQLKKKVQEISIIIVSVLYLRIVIYSVALL